MSKPRRGKGDGGLFELKDGTWRGYVSLSNGKRKYVHGKTKKEARAKLKKLQHAADAGQNLGQPSQTVEQFLTTWLEQVVKRKNAPRTYESYTDMCQRYLIPAFGRIRLDKLSPEHVQQLLNAMVDDGLKPRTAAYARSILRAALNVALKYGYLTRNVAALVDVPKDHDPFVGQAMTIAQVQQFLAALEGHRLEPLYRLTLALGLRKGEVINLRWQDFNATNQTLTINVSKTGTRTVALSSSLCAMLNGHRVYQMEEHLARRDWHDHGLIFPSERGTALIPRNLLHHFKRTLTKAGLPTSFRFHDLRHSAATLMAANGVHPRVAMEILGHRHIATTMEIYSHVGASEQQAAIETLERLWEA